MRKSYGEGKRVDRKDFLLAFYWLEGRQVWWQVGQARATGYRHVEAEGEE